jgi:hypothetical protein
MYKTFIKNHVISTTIFLFILIYIIIIYTKPSFLFTNHGSIRHFGLGKRNSTIIPIWLITIILVIFIYMSVLCYIR